MAAIRVENELGEWVPIQKGVRQGCVLSPDLLSLYSEKIQEVEGVQIGDMNINNETLHSLLIPMKNCRRR